MFTLVSSLILLLLKASASRQLQAGGGQTPSEATLDSSKVVISEACAAHGDSSDASQGGQEISLAAGSPLVLTHKIKLLPLPPDSGLEAYSCKADVTALRERVERLEREVSALRETCGGSCTSEESKGAGGSIQSDDECLNDCSGQGRCVDARCVCFPGYSGPDCSRSNCTGDCSHRGRCVEGTCVCDPGSTGPDCSTRTCPGDCSHRGRCVKGTCVCDPGSTGPDCSTRTCPANCSNRGRCVHGQCVCDKGFTGSDCSNNTCPNTCSGRGKCVRGKCVCSIGFVGPDCSNKSCPSNCSNKGRCVKERCVCRRGFTGPDCSQCDKGKIGPDCDTVMAGVSQLSTRDITATSATVFWTRPAVAYDSYHITFSSQKESEQQVTAQVDGGLSTFTQTGLAAGQHYMVTVSGEIGGRRGAKSTTQFMTLIPSPTNIQVVKTTTTSAVVQWEKAQGEIEQYRLTVTPRDGAEKKEMTVPADQNSAHILQLDTGRLYDIVLVAEKDASRSEAARTQAVPGTSSSVSTAALNVQVTQTPEQDVGSTKQEFKLSMEPPRGRKDEADPQNVGQSEEPSTSLIVRRKPLVTKLFKQPNAPVRFNTTRFVAISRRLGSGPLPGHGMKAAAAPNKPNPPVGGTPVTEPSPEGTDNRRPAVTSGPGPEPNMVLPDSEPTSETTGTLTQEKRCVNRMKVAQTRLALKGGGSGCREDGTVGEQLGSSDLDGSSDYSPDLLHKLLTDTFDSLNITTFSVHLVKPSRLSLDAETAKKQVLGGLKSLFPSGPQPSAAASSVSPSASSLASITSLNPTSPSITSLNPTSLSNSVGPDTTAVSLTDSGGRDAPQLHQASPKRGQHQLIKFGTFQSRSPINGTRRPLGLQMVPRRETQMKLTNAPVNVREAGVTAPESVADQDQKQETQRQVPVHHLPPKRGYMHRPLPDTGLHSQSGQTRRFLTRFSRPSSKAGTQKQQVSKPRPLPSILSPPVSEGAGPVRQGEADDTTPSSDLPASRAERFYHLRRHGGPSPNKTHLSPHLQRGLSHNLPSVKSKELPVSVESSLVGADGITGIQNQQLSPGLVPRGSVRRLGHKEMDTTITPYAQTSNSDPSQDTSDNSPERPSTRTPGPVMFPKQPLRHYVSGSSGQADTRPGHTGNGPLHYVAGTNRTLAGTKPGHTGNGRLHYVAGMNRTLAGTRPGHTGNGPLHTVAGLKQTSDGFTLWDSPEGKFKTLILAPKEADKVPNLQDGEKAQRGDLDGKAEDTGQQQPHRLQMGPASTPQEGRPGSSHSSRLRDLFPQMNHTLMLLGTNPGLLSRLHKLVISTGPKPPSNIVFSDVTENSLTVSWTKPKSPVSSFKVTYSPTEDADPVSVSVASEDSTLTLSQLLPGSSYEVSIMSVLGPDESDAVKEAMSTLPDPPTDLQAVNVTDVRALLFWRPALASVDQYSIVYSSATGSEVRISVSGTSTEQQLSGLEASTTYTVTVTSQQGNAESPPAATSFTTASSPAGNDTPRDLQASDVTPRAALLSWKPPSMPISGYRLTYQTEGQDTKEVSVEASVTEHHLTRLDPGSRYTVQLQAQRGGRYLSATSTDFTTGRLRFPFPSDCSQELLNGVRTSGVVEIFPQGKQAKPLTVYCDMETDGGGWTVFQRRKDGSVNFFRGWKDYMMGFGDLDGEFWLGLDNLHNLTAMSRMSLRVDLSDRNQSAFARYSTFDVAKKNYRLTVGGYSGTAGDSLSYHSNRIFSTRDRDPLQFITRCATSYRGGWWYKNCHEANLNGLYGVNVKHQGVIWTSWRGKDFSIPFTEMKMRPAAFKG